MPAAKKKLVTPRGLKAKPKQPNHFLFATKWWMMIACVVVAVLVAASSTTTSRESKKTATKASKKKTTSSAAAASEKSASWAEAVSKGDLLNRQGKYEKAEEAYLLAISADASLSPAFTNLAGVLFMQGRFSEAVGNASRAFRLSKTPAEYAAASVNLGLGLRGEGKEESALAAFLAGREADKSSVEVRNFAVTSALALGALDIAQNCSEEILALKKVGTAALALARLGRDDFFFEPDDEKDAAALFADFEIYNRKGDTEAAWQSVVAANRVALEQQLSNERRKAARREAETARAMATAVVEDFRWSSSSETSSRSTTTTTMPLLVVGPPRTGTTLVAAALSRHSEVDLVLSPRINDAVAHYGPGPFRDNNRTILDPLRDAYLRLSENKFVLESYPDNVWWVGAAAAVFEGALKVVLLSRDRDQTAFSIYKTFYELRHRDWTFDPDAIDARLDAYHLLTEQAKSYDFVKTVDFATLVENPDATINDILDFLDLERQPQCLEPAQTPLPFYSPANIELRTAASAGQNKDYTWEPYSTLLKERMRVSSSS